MPQIPRLPKKFPYRHLVMFFFVAVMVGIAAVVDSFLMEDYPWIDLIWVVPLAAAAFLLTPLEVIGFGMVSVILSLASEVHPEDNINLWTTALVGVFAILAAIEASLIRRSFRRVGMIQNALDDSPLAYAEFSFPGYRLLNSNQTFDELTGRGSRRGDHLPKLLAEDEAAKLAAIMDEAVNTRRRVTDNEFRIQTESGRNRFWGINIVPISPEKKATPRSLALFAFETTDAVSRARTRDAALRISAAVMSSLSLEETIRVVLDNLAFIANTDAGAIFLLEDDQWVGMAGFGEHDDEIHQKHAPAL